MAKEESFEETCRTRFLYYCDLRQRTPYHIDKRRYAEKAWVQIDAYLDWRDVQGL
jgi:hypothetical protein